MTGVFVEIAAIDRLVRKVIDLATRRINTADQIPACPMTKPADINITTPRMVKIEGVNTPPIVPN